MAAVEEVVAVAVMAVLVTVTVMETTTTCMSSSTLSSSARTTTGTPIATYGGAVKVDPGFAHLTPHLLSTLEPKM